MCPEVLSSWSMIFNVRCIATGRRPPTPAWKGWLRNWSRSSVDTSTATTPAHQECLNHGWLAAVGEEEKENEDHSRRKRNTSRLRRRGNDTNGAVDSVTLRVLSLGQPGRPAICYRPPVRSGFGGRPFGVS